MKKTFAILLASTAIAVGAGIPAWSSMHGAALSSASADEDRLVRLASDDDRDDGDQERSGRRGGDDDRHGDDDDGEGDDDDDDDDDGYGGSATANPAPAGTVAPPANGLFGSGAAPKAKVN
jgi:hypothetical protein